MQTWPRYAKSGVQLAIAVLGAKLAARQKGNILGRVWAKCRRKAVFFIKLPFLILRRKNAVQNHTIAQT